MPVRQRRYSKEKIARRGDEIYELNDFVTKNPDKVEHFRLLGNNPFGVEYLCGGGDKDFNDIIIKMNFHT